MGMADAVISASHGEGWGLPLLEAMSVGLPTAAVNWSGNTAFMNHNNSFLINMTGLTEEDTPMKEHHWAELDLNHTRAIMREIYSSRHSPSAIAKQARQDVQTKRPRCFRKSLKTRNSIGNFPSSGPLPTNRERF